MRKVLRTIVSLVILSHIVVISASALEEQGNAGSVRNISDSVSAEMKRISKVIKPPEGLPGKTLPASIEIGFPEFSPTSKSDIAAVEINAAVKGLLLDLAGDRKPADVEQLIGMFSEGYLESLKKRPDSLGGWRILFDAKIRFFDEQIVSLEVMGSIFSGGAHPGTKVTFRTFSLKTGQPIPLSSVVKEDNHGELAKIAEKRFRESRKIGSEEALSKAGFSFKGDLFTLNGNFLFSKEGLEFCFNHYEIAPYSMGIIRFAIPWSDLKSLVDLNGPAAGCLKP